MAHVIEAFGTAKEVMDWLEDSRIDSQLTRDVLVKRVKRGWNGEKAIRTPVVKGAAVGDTAARKKAREDKLARRASMFQLAQQVRRSWAKGAELEDLQRRYKISKSQVEKMVYKTEWYNVHWDGSADPSLGWAGAQTSQGSER